MKISIDTEEQILSYSDGDSTKELSLYSSKPFFGGS